MSFGADKGPCSNFTDWSTSNGGSDPTLSTISTGTVMRLDAGYGIWNDQPAAGWGVNLYTVIEPTSTSSPLADEWNRCESTMSPCYRRWDFYGTCTLCSAPAAGSLTTPAAICSGSSTTIAGSAVSGASYQWMKEGTYGAGNWAVFGGNVQSLSTGALTTKTRFVRIAQKCSPLQSSGWVYVTVTVYSAANNPGAISVPATICQGTATNISNVTVATTGTPASSVATYRFYYKGGPSNVAWTQFSQTTSSSVTLPAAVTNTPGQWYVARNSKFTCSGWANNGTTINIPIRVDATSALGSPSTAGPVNFCSAAGNFGTAVTVSGHTGSVTWNYGKNNGWWSGTWGSFTTSSGVNTFPKLTTNPSSADRIRYKVTNGACPAVTSGAILISNYHNNAASSIISNINNVCPSTVGTLTATFPGAVNMRGKVEFATTINGPAFASITPTAGQTVFTTNVAPPATTTYYVRYSGINNGGASCYSTSQSVVVTVNSTTNNPGAISVPASICVGTATNISNVTVATTGTPASSVPTYYFYYKLEGQGGYTMFLSTTASSAALPAVVINTTGNHLVARNSAFACTGQTNDVNTVNIPITVTPNRTVAAASSSPTLCINTAMTNITHATTGVTAVGISSGLPAGVTASYSGNVITLSGTPTASGTFNYTITPSGCGSATATGTIIVDAAAVGGSIATAVSGCYGDNGATLTLSGHTGTISKWQKNENGGGWTDIGNAGLTTYTYSNLIITTQYRAVLTNGICSTNSADVTVTVYADLTSGSIGAAQTISAGSTPATLTETVAAAGGDGSYTYQWQSSTDGATFANVVGATNPTYSPGALSFDTWYKRIITLGSSCGSETSNSIKVTVNKYVCSGSNPSAIASISAASGGGGGSPTYQWQSSADGTTYANVIGQTGSVLSPGSIAQNTWYRRMATINGCVLYSNVLKATISGGSPGGVSTGLTVWLKADAGTGSINTIWEDQSGSGNHYNTVSGPALVTAGDSSSNFNPYIEIKNGGFTAPSGAMLGTNYTIIAAAKRLPSDNTGRILDGDISGYDFGLSGTNTDKKVHVITSATLPASGVRVNINQGFTSVNKCHSHVYELIIYNSVLSPSEINIIKSYLETKWGVVNRSNNYLNSEGAATFDVAVAPTYVNDIIGIGKECYFHQKQSESVDDSVKIYLSTLASTNLLNGGAVTNDASYLMLGHDNGLNKATAASNAEVPAAGALGTNGYVVNSRLAREWKVTNTNFTDNYTIKISVIDQSKITDFSDLCLLIDDDGDFTNCNILAANEGITFESGSIVIKGLGVASIAAGATKFITIGTKKTTSTLPVELISFSASSKGEYNELTWVTGAEINNDYFSIQKSDDGVNWEQIGTEAGNGNSYSELTYSFQDYELCNNVCYYRLEQFDFDGKSKLSAAVVLEHVEKANINLNIYPNPVLLNTTVEFAAPSTGMYNMSIISVNGQSVYEAKVVCAEGENDFQIKTSQLAPGMYHLVIRDDTGELMDKVNFAK